MAGVCVLAVVVVTASVLTWWALGRDSYVVQRGQKAVPQARPGEASRALAQLVSAVRSGDTDAAAAVGDQTSAGLLGDVASNARALEVVDFDLRYVDEVGAVTDGDSWQAAVDVTWRFDGFDAEAAREEVLVGFRSIGERVAVVSLGGGDRRTPLWFTGPLEVRRSATTLVLTAGGPAEADLIDARARAAVPVVRAVLPEWPGGLVVEVPASSAQLDDVLDADDGTYTNVAAVTATVDGSLAPDTPIHVFLNPGVYNKLEPVGSQVVLNHEATHVATAAPLHTLPIWLLEGFADFVALRDVTLPIDTTAGQVITEVREDGPPDALPDQADFDETSTSFGAAYEAAWLACRTVADRAGESALVSLYQRVSDGAPLARVLRQETGLSVAQLTRAWQERLSDLAG